MIQYVRVPKRVKVPEGDAISLAEAAKLLDMKLPNVGNLLDRGELPWLELPTPDALKRKRAPRWTSRQAVNEYIASREARNAARSKSNEKPAKR
jgi:hypothetical protein